MKASVAYSVLLFLFLFSLLLRDSSQSRQDISGCSTTENGAVRFMYCNGLQLSLVPLAPSFSVFELSLRDNLLDKIKKNDFKGWESLRDLSLTRNSVSLIENEAFKVLPQLKKLDLSFNSISFPEGLGPDELPSTLESLDLSNNPLGVIPNRQFFSLTRLRILKLSSAQIHTMEPKSLTGLVNLHRLYLFHNRLQSLPRLYFRQSLGGMPSLNSLLLGGRNPWHCDCNLRWLKEWQNDRPDVNVMIVGPDKKKYGPTCASPPDMKSKGLFDPQVLSQEFACPSQRDNTAAKIGRPVTPTPATLAVEKTTRVENAIAEKMVESSEKMNGLLSVIEEASPEDVIPNLILYGSIAAAWIIALCFAVGACCFCVGVRYGRRRSKEKALLPPEQLPPPFTTENSLPELQACVAAIQEEHQVSAKVESVPTESQKPVKKVEHETESITVSYVSSI